MNAPGRGLAIAAIAALGVAAGVAAGLYLRPAVPPPAPEMRTLVQPKPVEQVAEFRFLDLEGRERDAREWRGKVLVVNFWATWSPPCRAQIPGFVDLQNQYGAAGLQFVGIATDDEQAVREFVSRYGISYPILLGDEAGSELARAFGNEYGGLPYTVVFDRDGRLKRVFSGLVQHAEAEAVIKPLL